MVDDLGEGLRPNEYRLVTVLTKRCDCHSWPCKSASCTLHIK